MTVQGRAQEYLHQINLQVVGPQPRRNGNYILTCTDRFSIRMGAVPMPDRRAQFESSVQREMYTLESTRSSLLRFLCRDDRVQHLIGVALSAKGQVRQL